ncbi:fumarylacetoacetate hydrolase family protein [Kribbella yunnanensis]|uniref:Fumarylacetoacetate hydrolase family protein n=1 Tax=Kribbella yunnanensis TaxID=190194 RepID=A0ABP4UMP3_9ACTN
MNLAVVRTDTGPRVVVRRRGDEVVQTAYRSLRAALEANLQHSHALREGAPVDPATLEFAPVADRDAKVFCIGHNYRAHIREMGHDLPTHPNVFSKFGSALVGATDAIELDRAAAQWDWEAELAVVIGGRTRRVTPQAARAQIAGYTVANDISARDWQRRSSQWLLGKTFEKTTPVGPWLVTPDEVDPEDGLDVRCLVDGVEKQAASTADLLFRPAFLVSYLSQVLTLEPGDVVLTGTPGGVGAARTPAERLTPGQTVRTEIDGLGCLVNTCIGTGSPEQVPTSTGTTSA